MITSWMAQLARAIEYNCISEESSCLMFNVITWTLVGGPKSVLI